MAEQTLEQFFGEGTEGEVEPEAVSRRKFLTGAVAGGAAGLAAAAGTGVAVWKVADAELLAAKEAAEAELQALKASSDSDLARMQALVDLYEGLEKVGLDAILEAGMVAMALPREAVEAGAKVLKRGLEWAEEGLRSLAESLPTARESLAWLERQVAALAGAIEALEAAVGRALDRALDNPIGQALKDFSDMVLDYLPFGLGDRIRGVLDGLVEVVTSVDELVVGVNTHLLEPLDAKWFSEEEEAGLSATLVNPLVERVLDPLEAHLGDLSTLSDTWQAKLMAPAQDALAERARIRGQIASYKSEHGLG
ncbi:MAG: hypothetical protein P8129_00960 [Anaerolineae bacterium]